MRVVTLNLWKNEGDLPARLQMVAAECLRLKPDIICLQEVYADAEFDTGAWLAQALGLSVTSVPARMKQRSGVLSSSGLALLSSLPLVSQESIDLPTSAADGGRKALFGSFETSLGPARIVSLHLSHLNTDEGEQLRQLQLSTIWSWVREGWEHPIILAGDFNAKIDAPCLSWLRTQAQLVGTDSLLPGETSLRDRPGALIDHVVLAGQNRVQLSHTALCFKEMEAEAGRVASDHFGIVADFDAIG